ncbi:solute carrier family 25 member 35-like isoform X1 [Plodia interpunctella]|uniref:solute carrier family 25 member 35-like isoform X1 n=1 Tax=Plodia interpunctella TaxID=58824 RepID=UPI002367AC11|nr:solute carrier family 25 member 35-like isoform X1 [Plodia interpunctella]XP_053626073.1 solute carrier family 25 member 35-like isoform X1 [Plodia interpunctella]
MDFIIGGLAGAGATIFTNPMDVVKTRMQLQGELKSKAEQATRYKGVLHALYVIAKADGAMALQKGLVPALVLGFSMNSVRLGTYHIAEVQGWTKTKDGDVSFQKAVLWSSVSGILSGLTGNPASVVKTRIQSASHPSIAVGRQHRYKGLWDGCRQIYKVEGLRGFFAGVEATCARLAVGSAAQLTTFSFSKEALQSRGTLKESPFLLAFCASAISGVAVALAICPMDVATVRLYNQGPASGGLLYTGVIDCLTKIYRTEGLHGLYKGLGPLYLRIAPHTTLSLVIWDLLNDIVTDRRNKTR